MGGTIGAVARALTAAVVWGVVLAGFYRASLIDGAWIGLWAWGPAIVLSARWRGADPAPTDIPIDAF